MSRPPIGIIGGTGFGRLATLAETQRIDVSTPFGSASCPIIYGTIDDAPVAFLARHGNPHAIAPHRVNYRANIAALADAGVDALELSTEGDLLDALLRFAELREMRSRASTGGGTSRHIAAHIEPRAGTAMEGGRP